MIKYEARGIGPAEESIKLELESQYKPVSVVIGVVSNEVYRI